MEKNKFFEQYVFRTSVVVFLTVLALSVAERQYGLCSPKKTSNQCGSDKFQCLDGGCIPKSRYCNGNYDCYDGSDENYCGFSYESCPNSPRRFIRCSGSSKCIPEEWRCDRSTDCPSGDDERNCPTDQSEEYSANFVMEAKTKAIDWLLKRAVPTSANRKWGPLVHKTAVAFYLSDPTFLSNDSSVRKEITYELSIRLLSRINQKKLQGISSSELASFINAFLVTCTDPRDFNGFNLVEELRSRVDKQNYTNPYLLLTLCNAGDAITVSDVEKLVNIFWNNNREIPTDSQAIALMAISCARNQTDSVVVDEATVKELALELKQRQYRNGTVENLHTTLLVMQALYAAEADEDPDNFDEKKALSYILQNQKSDGSFGNLLLTYYALPLLNCRSMINITSSHCEKVRKDEETFVFDLVNYVGPKISIRYSIWYGKDTDVGRTLSVKVPTNISFYRAMEIAAEMDSKYRFEYVVKNRKPYITAVSGTLDDPESETFWFPYIIKDEKPKLLQKSTADVRLKNSDHIIMWYREGSWAE